MNKECSKMLCTALCAITVCAVITSISTADCPDESQDIWPDYDPGAGNYEIVVDANTVYQPISPFFHGQSLPWERSVHGLVNERQTSTGPIKYHDSHVIDNRSIPCVKGRLDELKPGLLHFPVNMIYNFRDGIGPRQDFVADADDNQERPARMYNSGSGYRDGPWQNHFGTDEFVQLCASYGATPIMNLNLHGQRHWPSSVTEEDWQEAERLAANWVEYCNGVVTDAIRLQASQQKWQPTTWSGTDPDKYEVAVPGRSWISTDTAPKGYFAWLRERFGHTSPYKIRYWKINNEIYYINYTWATADTYRERFVKIADAVRAVDPQIILGIDCMAAMDSMSYADAMLGTGKRWNETVMGLGADMPTEASKRANFLDIHLYSGPMSHYGELFYWCNGRFCRSVTVDTSGTRTITVRMRNTGGSSNVLLKVDGVAQPSASSSCTWVVDSTICREYQCQVDLEKGVHEIKVVLLSNAISGLFVSWVKLSQGMSEVTLVDQNTECRTIFGSQEYVAEQAQSLLDTYYDKDIMVTQTNIMYGPDLYPENEEDDAYAVHKMKCALGVVHLTNRLLKMQSAHSSRHIMAKNHWIFCERGVYDFDYDGIEEAKWETRNWRMVYHDFVDGTDRIGVTPTYHLLKAYTKYARGTLVDCRVTSKRFGVPLNRDTWWDHERWLNYVDAIAVKEGNRVRILAANRGTEPYRFTITINGGVPKPRYVNIVQYKAAGMDEENLGISSQKIKLGKTFAYTFPACSFVVMEFE